MELTREEEKILGGGQGNAAAKSMKILIALGEIYGAERLIPVGSVQIAGVSYDNLGDAGLEYLSELARDGQVKVLTTLNPAGMDMREWKKLGISDEFAAKQKKVVEAFAKMGVITTCTCTPYLIGNLPAFGEHVAWAESSAVTFVNSVIGARSNREGGPSAIAAAMIGKTPAYGLHLDENRAPKFHVKVDAKVESLSDWGALGYVIGKASDGKVPYITGLKQASTDSLKSFGASAITYGSPPLYHIRGITPEASQHKPPKETVTVADKDMKEAYKALNDDAADVDFVSLGCPHASIQEIAEISDYLKNRKVRDGVELWVATARPTKDIADERGYTQVIEQAGGKMAVDTCMVVAPIKGRFKTMATTSAKACFYARGKNKLNVHIGDFKQCLNTAVTGKWN
ncbi:MAG: aconitase X catalytic domain-containing protein [Candidatus Altiarchaeota archaeon]